PSEDTAGAFLWMIWQEKVAIVVMVSDMNESAEQTCSPYWPMKEGTSRHYGKMSVALKGIKNYPDYSVRELLIMKKGEDSISVTQFHYHSWPYRRVAEHPTSLLDFIKDVKLCLKRKHFPLLVHCSDGAGATGTFIGLFCLLDELTQSSEISIYHFVQKMRKTRINMVGTKAQYVFMYEVLLLAYQTPVTVYSAHDFKKLVINKRKLSGQFQSLLKPKYQIDAQSGSATENKNRNRFSKIIPLDVSSPHLQCTSLIGGSGYINACFANSHFKKNAFILTQSPLPTTVEDFWRMVYDQKSTKIIMLNMLDSTDKVTDWFYKG
ncbi:putative receptor-type tyrosine-protein phosphatase alpha, partial [Apostichopus japonicus]